MATRTVFRVGKQIIGNGKNKMVNSQHRLCQLETARETSQNSVNDKYLGVLYPMFQTMPSGHPVSCPACKTNLFQRLSECARIVTPTLLQSKWSPLQDQQQRAFFLPKLPSPFPARMKSEILGYAEQRILGFSMQQMFDVVADVEQYEHFVPWCLRSTTHDHHQHGFRCTFTVGFPPVTERYSSDVTVCQPHLVKSVSTETKLFRHLVTTWQFSPGYEDNPDTCTLDYKVSFQFHSALYSHLAQLFFDQVVHTMVDSFLRHAQTLYGHPTITHGQKKILRSGLLN